MPCGSPERQLLSPTCPSVTCCPTQTWGATAMHPPPYPNLHVPTGGLGGGVGCVSDAARRRSRSPGTTKSNPISIVSSPVVPTTQAREEVTPRVGSADHGASDDPRVQVTPTLRAVRQRLDRRFCTPSESESDDVHPGGYPFRAPAFSFVHSSNSLGCFGLETEPSERQRNYMTIQGRSEYILAPRRRRSKRSPGGFTR
jgi:hypothetical protein